MIPVRNYLASYDGQDGSLQTVRLSVYPQGANCPNGMLLGLHLCCSFGQIFGGQICLGISCSLSGTSGRVENFD